MHPSPHISVHCTVIKSLEVKVTLFCLSVCSVSQLPAGIKLSKDAQTAICKAASVFVLYCTAWLVGTELCTPACMNLLWCTMIKLRFDWVDVG